MAFWMFFAAYMFLLGFAFFMGWWIDRCYDKQVKEERGKKRHK